jgi:hypothetical protein
MKSIKVLRTFQFADEGADVVEYEHGSTHDVSDECAQVAIEERWAELAE